MKLEDLKVDIYADGADIGVMCRAYECGLVKGFTTNPSLMRQAGVKSYTDFARAVVDKIPDLPISFEVFSDRFETMKKEAEKLSSYGANVFVKIPITNVNGESSAPLIRELSAEGVKLNITAIFTIQQVQSALEALSNPTENIISVFAGRIADTGIDPEPVMRETAALCAAQPGVKSLWASCREVFNLVQAARCGVDIITVTDAVMKKLTLMGKDLEAYSLETVRTFDRDGKSLGFSIL